MYLRLFWSKTVRRTQKQKPTEKSSVCLSTSEFAKLLSTPFFASRAEILSQIQLCRRLYRASWSFINLSLPYIKTYKFWYRYKTVIANPGQLASRPGFYFIFQLFLSVPSEDIGCQAFLGYFQRRPDAMPSMVHPVLGTSRSVRHIQRRR